MNASAHTGPDARVCVLILMNHPFPKIIPLLRKIYAGRFSTVRFLIPFERMDDEDVITVYRGSYNHAAYLTDACHLLEQIDCDHFIVVHDDVLLNPQLNEATFRSVFPIRPADGFIAKVGATPTSIQTCCWWFGMVPKMLHSKSLLFGTGIEPENLSKYLPPMEKIAPKIEAQGIVPNQRTRFNVAEVNAGVIGNPPAKVILHGLSHHSRIHPETQGRIDGHAAASASNLLNAMLQYYNAVSGGDQTQENVDLPFPTIGANFYTDMYVLPKSGLADYCHYVGVAGAANLFVEMMAPTALAASCEKLFTAADLGLDFGGFEGPQPLAWLEDPRHVAIHPFKLSRFLAEDQGDKLVQILHELAAFKTISDGAIAKVGFGSAVSGAIGLDASWHPPHDWGVWAAATDAIIPVALDGSADIRLTLVAVLDPAAAVQTGRIIYNGGRNVCEFESMPPSKEIYVTLRDVRPGPDGVAALHLISDSMVRPCDIDPASGDQRPLGFAFSNMLVSAREPVEETAAL